MDEPGYLSMSLTPAVIYYLFKGFYPRKQSLITLICFLLTFGSVSYIVFFIAIWYKIFKKNRYKVVVISLLSIVGLMSIPGIELKAAGKNANGLVRRFSDTISGIGLMKPNNFEGLNLSTYALLTNTWVAFNAPLRLTGTGLGTHSQNYESTYKSNFRDYGLNKEDGYSFFNRVFSELGLLGCIIVLCFIIRHFNSKSTINIACLFILLTFLLRGGHYVRYGFIFWIYMFYYSSHSIVISCNYHIKSRFNIKNNEDALKVPIL